MCVDVICLYIEGFLIDFICLLSAVTFTMIKSFHPIGVLLAVVFYWGMCI